MLALFLQWHVFRSQNMSPKSPSKPYRAIQLYNLFRTMTISRVQNQILHIYFGQFWWYNLILEKIAKNRSFQVSCIAKSFSPFSWSLKQCIWGKWGILQTESSSQWVKNTASALTITHTHKRMWVYAIKIIHILLCMCFLFLHINATDWPQQTRYLLRASKNTSIKSSKCRYQDNIALSSEIVPGMT